jgi:endonuclease YncB( thermonuclease family)
MTRGPALTCLGTLLHLCLMTGTALALADEVIDGDTLVVEGQHMRLFGIDAFELQQTCLDRSGQPWHCGVAAKAALAELVQDQAIACTVIDDSGDNGYVARCTVRDEVDLGGYLVRAGLALADPNDGGDYVSLERSARAAAAGAWAGTFAPPWNWRQQ